MKTVTVLIPTYNRVTALAATLTSLCTQSFTDFNVVISDQSDEPVGNHPTIQTLVRLLQYKNIPISIYYHLPRNGMAEQRDFLLSHTSTTYSHFIDDDVIMENYVLKNMVQAIKKYNCGFVGMPVIGLSYMNHIRKEEQSIEFWHNKVTPEKIEPGDKKWQRYKLHNAANPLHIAEKYNITQDNPKIYKVSWVGGCTLYNTDKLLQVGGFSFWKDLPSEHCGEDVLAQIHVMAKFGGCGILPSGVYHQELPTTVKKRNINAPEYLEKN